MTGVEKYLRTLAHEKALGVAETTHYSALKDLLNEVGGELAPPAFALVHPATPEGIPDFGLFATSQKTKLGEAGPKKPERGVVEAKPIGTDLAKIGRSDQALKYLKAHGHLVVTDYLGFAVYALANGAAVERERYALPPTALNDPGAATRRHGVALAEFLGRAMSYQTAILRPDELARPLASYAREALHHLRRRGDAGEDLSGLRHALAKALGVSFDETDGERFFQSEIVQTLFFAIFSGWVLWHGDDAKAGPFDQTAAFKNLRVPIIRSLFQNLLGQLIGDDEMTRILGNVYRLLDRVDRAEFFAHFSKDDAVQYFYEPFLAAFDPETREKLGVWYTPREIVRYQVETTDRIVRESFGLPLGLADPTVRVLDPCCGTGAYLMETLTLVAARLKEHADGPAEYRDRLSRFVRFNLLGFELLPAPLVVAHLRVLAFLQKEGIVLKPKEQAAIYLTNALTGWREDVKLPSDAANLHLEREAADRVRRSETVLAVIGNPPYNGYAGIAAMPEETEHLTIAGFVPKGARKGQGLNDLYARFFAMADRKLDQKGRGVISFITNYSWLDGLSFGAMREKLLERYDEIRVDNLHGDKYATGKKTPEGAPDPSAFSTRANPEGIQVGTAVATLIRRPGGDPAGHVRYRDFWGVTKREDLLASLSEVEDGYRTVTPNAALGNPFRPRDVSPAYLASPRLPELFPDYVAGVQTKRDEFLVDIEREKLVARLKDYGDADVTDAVIAARYPRVMEKSAQFDPSETRRAVRKRGIVWANVVRFAYRPFDVRWVYWEPTGNLLGRRSPLSFPLAQVDGQVFLVSQQRTRRGWDAPVITRDLPNLHLTEWSGSCMPLKLAGGLLGEGYNISDRGRAALAAAGLEAQPDCLFFHALAVTHAPRYAVENEGALRQDWPRVPVDLPAEVLLRGRERGRRVAALLDPSVPVPGVTEGDVPPSLRSVARYGGERETVELRAAWGYRGREGVTMAGNGRLVERPDGTLDVAMDARDAAVQDAWTGVPRAVWEYRLGGYQVLKKWLSYREFGVLGRALTLAEIREFSHIARRIAALQALGPDLDAHYATCLPPGTADFSRPTAPL